MTGSAKCLLSKTSASSVTVEVCTDARQLLEAGYDAKLLRAAGFGARHLLQAGLSPRLLEAAGFTARQLQVAEQVMSLYGESALRSPVPLDNATVLLPGQRVTIVGLTSVAGTKLNGTCGTVRGFHAESRRYKICFDSGDPPSDWKRLRQENLVADSATASDKSC